MLAEITVVSKATSRGNSLRTTIPASIVRLFGLKEGDKLAWRIKILDGRIVIVLEPVKGGSGE